MPCNNIARLSVNSDDELSKNYDDLLSQENNMSNTEKYVALKLSNKSVEFEQFKKIYVTVPIPSVFLIGSNGIPLRIICSQKPSDLHSAICEAVKKHKENLISNGKQIKPNGYTVEDKTTQNSKAASDKNKLARIQLRLPSNEICFRVFANTATLTEVRAHLKDTMKMNWGFKFVRVYPRTVFGPEDENKTLTDLSLTPNGTLIVLKDETVSSKMKKMVTTNFTFTMVAALFQPVLSLLIYLKNLIMGNSGQNKSKPERKEKIQLKEKRFSRKSCTSNIHSFAFDESDSDSDMNTDNGNSTEQK